MEYLVPSMLENASALLGDFGALYQEWAGTQEAAWLYGAAAQISRGTAEIKANILQTEVAGLNQGIKQAH